VSDADPLVIDGDYPMAYGAFELGRDLTRPLAEVRAAGDGADVAMASLPELRRGGVAVALVKVVGRIARPGNPLPGYAGGDASYGAAQGQLAYYRSLAERGEARLLTRRGELTAHLATWRAAADRGRLPVGFILGMEGADPILRPAQARDWWAAGLRVVSLTHYGVSAYAHGTGAPGGLLPPAGALLRAMEEIGLILDLTHLADESFWGALDAYGGPVLASHQTCRALVAGERQFADDQLRAVIARGGVIGVAMDAWMLWPDGKPDWRDAGGLDRRRFFPRAAVTLAHVADHIDHICQLAGDARHAAIGGDTDGQGGVEGAPAGVDSVADYRRVAEVLARRGYDAEAVASVLHGNWQRFFERWLPACSPGVGS
jgi:membrane dipeptidase